MTKEEPYRDQAEKLRQKIEKIHEPNDEDSSLPPRSDLHRHKKKKTKWKLKYPLIRLLVLFFILLPITIFSVYSYLADKHISSEKASVSSKGYETINFEKAQKKQKAKVNSTNKKNSSTEDSSVNTSNAEQPQDSGSSNVQESLLQNPVSNNNPTTGQDLDKNGNGQTNPSTSQANRATSQPSATINQSDTKRIVYHTVKPSETLYRIAKKYYQSNTGVETIKRQIICEIIALKLDKF